MLNKLLGDFINGAISAHTSRIKNQDVSLKFFQNSFNITELELYKFALFQYGFPIVIKCGIIKNIEIIVPWTTFQTDSVKITIDDIFILATFPGSDPENFISDQDLYDIREHQLAAHHEFSKKFNNILKQISSQKLSQIVKRVMHSCSIEIKNLHLRIEIENPLDKEKCHSFGLITSSINIFTQNPSKGVPSIIEKIINLNDLAAYLDLDQEKVKYLSNEDFIRTMKKLSKIEENHHQFLLEPSLISAKLTSSTEIELSNIEILTDLNNIVLSISKMQLPVIMKMASNVKKFNQFMFIRKCKKFAEQFRSKNNQQEKSNENNNSNQTNSNVNNTKIENSTEKVDRPNNNSNLNSNNTDDSDDCSDFDPCVSWVFFHTLAKKKNDSPLDSILDRILYRNRYVKEWNKLLKKSDRSPTLVKLDHQLDYQAILYFRSLADSIKALTLKINHDELYRFVNFDPLLLLPSFASRFVVIATGIMMKIKYVNQADKFDCRIILKGPTINYGQKQLHFGLESLEIVFQENENNFDALKMISPHKNIISVDASFQSFTSGSFTISSEPMKFSIDLSRIFALISNLDLKFDQNLLDKLKIEKNNYKIDIELNEMHFLPFYQDNVFFDFGFKSFICHPNELNSKEYLISINDISFSQNNFYIFNDLNLNLSTFHGILNVSIPYFKVNLMKKDFEKLDELKNFLKSTSMLSQKVPFNLKNVKIDFEGVDVYSDLLKNKIVLNKSEIVYLVDLYKSELTVNLSRVEIGYIVIENVVFNLNKKPNFIQSTLLVNQFSVKELQVKINSAAPFLKGIYNHIEETMDLSLGVDSVEFSDLDVMLNIRSFLIDILSLATTKKVSIIPTNSNENLRINITNNESSSSTNVVNDLSSSSFIVNRSDSDNDESSFLKSLFNLVGSKELKLPKINLTIHFVPRPITIIYDKFNFFIDFELSFLFNPLVVTFSIPSIKISFNDHKYFELKNFTFILSQNYEINISALHIFLNITEKIIQETKSQYKIIEPLINKLAQKKINFNASIPSVKVNIQSISLTFSKLFKKYSIRIPFSQLSLSMNDKKSVILNTGFYVECEDIGLEIEPINVTMNYHSVRNDQAIELQILNPLKVNFSPLALKKFIASENIFYVNQTGIELNLIVDEKQFTIPNNSSFISPHFPLDTKICFLNGKSKTFFDLSKLYAEQSIAFSLNSGMILIWKQQSLIIFSSPIEILNTTGYSIQLLDDYFNNEILLNNQIMFVPPEIESKVKTLSVSFLGAKLKIRARLLNYPYSIKTEDSFFRFIIERNTTSLVARVTITATIFLRSNFSEPLVAEFECKSGPKKYILHPRIKVPICLFDINTNRITFKLTGLNKNGYFNDRVYTINLPLSGGEVTVSLQNPKNKKDVFYLRFRVIEEKVDTDVLKTIDISAPIFIINHLGLSVIFSCNDKDKKTLNDFNSTHPPKNRSLFRPCSKLPGFRNNAIPYCFVKDEEVSFYLSHPMTMKYTASKFGVSKINSKELALLPTSRDDDTVMPVTFQVVHDETDTAIIFLRPYVVIYNNTNKQISIDKKVLELNHYLIVRSVPPSLDMSIESNGMTIPINLQNISDFSVTGPSLRFRIQFTISFINEVKFITISTVNSLGLFAVINDTDNNFIINQAGMEISQYFVLPQSSFLFDLSDTRTECTIECRSENISTFSVQFDHPMDAVPIPGIPLNSPQIYYGVEILGNNRYVCHFTQKSPSFEKVENSSLNFILNVPSISMKLLGRFYREYCRVTLGPMILHLLHQEMKESIAFSIDSIQVDDMNEFADHPVVLLSTKKPFFNLGLLKTINSSFFEYLMCKVTPIAAEIDISFVMDILSLFELENVSKSSSNNDSNEVDLLKSMNKNVTFHCLLLKILPIDFDLSFFTRTPRQFHRFEENQTIPKFLSIVPTIENFHLQMSPINAVDLRCNRKEFFLILLDNAKSSFSTQWLHLIGSAAIIGNPQQMVHNFSSAFKKPGKQIPKELLIGTAGTLGSILKTGETALKGISSTFRAVSNDDQHYIRDNKTALGGFSWGLKSFVSGFTKAATGIVTKPIEGAKEKGFAGAVKGAGEGLVGIVTNSVGGAVDLTAGIITGVRRGIFGAKVPTRIEEPMVKHRSYIKKVNEFIYTNDNNACIINRMNFIFMSDEADISENFVFIGENEIEIEDINWVRKVENSKIVSIETSKYSDVIDIEFSKEKVAHQFQAVLQLQVERKITQKIFTIPYPLDK